MSPVLWQNTNTMNQSSKMVMRVLFVGSKIGTMKPAPINFLSFRNFRENGRDGRQYSAE